MLSVSILVKSFTKIRNKKNKCSFAALLSLPCHSCDVTHSTHRYINSRCDSLQGFWDKVICICYLAVIKNEKDLIWTILGLALANEYESDSMEFQEFFWPHSIIGFLKFYHYIFPKTQTTRFVPFWLPSAMPCIHFVYAWNSFYKGTEADQTSRRVCKKQRMNKDKTGIRLHNKFINFVHLLLVRLKIRRNQTRRHQKKHIEMTNRNKPNSISLFYDHFIKKKRDAIVVFSGKFTIKKYVIDIISMIWE